MTLCQCGNCSNKLGERGAKSYEGKRDNTIGNVECFCNNGTVIYKEGCANRDNQGAEDHIHDIGIEDAEGVLGIKLDKTDRKQDNTNDTYNKIGAHKRAEGYLLGELTDSGSTVDKAYCNVDDLRSNKRNSDKNKAKEISLSALLALLLTA